MDGKMALGYIANAVSKLCKLVVKKVTFVDFMGGDCPSDCPIALPTLDPPLQFSL